MGENKEPLDLILETPAYPAGHLEVVSLDGREAISELFHFDLLVAARNASEVDAEALIGGEATLIFQRGGRELRRVYGMIATVSDRLDIEAKHDSFHLRLVPRAFRLTMVDTLDVFLDASVPDIVRGKLVECGFKEGRDFEMRLHDEYPEREFVVQYKETDLAFLSRITEHLGISFFFEHTSGRDVLVLTDHNDGFHPIVGNDAVPLKTRGDRVDVHRLEEKLRMIPAQYVIQDYNYRTPQVALTGKAGVESGLGTVVEYGSHVKTPREAEALAHVRAQERIASRRVFEGASDVERFAAGSRFKLENAPGGDFELLLTEVRHRATQQSLGGGKDRTPGYENDFWAIKAAVRFRPARATPKPRIHGVVTGVIDASNKGQYAEIDDLGRYRVRFLFDTTSPDDGKGSRLVRMAQPHAGAGYGMHFPLRPGVEVILTFIDGDPDRPIIAATVPNPQTASPVHSGNAPRNIIRTGSGNEVNFDDTDKGERIKLSTPHKNTTFQLGSPNSPERGAMLETEGASSSVALAGVAGFTSLHTTFSAIGSFFSSGNITTVAEKPSFGDGVTGVGEIIAGMIETATAGVDIAEQIRAEHIAELNLAAIREQEKAKKIHDDSAAARADVTSKQAAMPTPLSPDLQAKVDAYNAAQAQYTSDMASYASNQEFLRDSDKGNVTGAMLGEIDEYKASIQGNVTALDGDPTVVVPPVPVLPANPTPADQAAYDDATKAYEAALKQHMGSKAYLAQKQSDLKAALDAIPANDPSHSSAAAYSASLTAAETAEGDERAEWDTWNDPNHPMVQYDQAVLDHDNGDDAQDLKEAKIRLQEIAMASTILFSVAAQTVALIKWIIHRVKSKKKFSEYLKQRWEAKGRTLKKHLPWKDRDKVTHTLGSKGDTEIEAKHHLHLTAESAVMTAKNTSIEGTDTLHLHTDDDLELVAADTITLTSHKLDISSDGEVKLTVVPRAGPAMPTSPAPIAPLGAKLTALVRDNILVTSEEGNIRLEAIKKEGQKIEIAAKTTLLAAAPTTTLNATKIAKIISGSWSLAVNGEEGTVALGSSQWALKIKDANVQLGGHQSGLTATSSATNIHYGLSKVNVQNAKIDVTTSGTVELKGQQIVANGKCLLG